VSDKYAFIDAEYAAACAPTIERMCRWLQVSKSEYYEWLNRPPSRTAQPRRLLKIKTQALFEACDGSYGYRRLHAELVRGGEPVGSELVGDITYIPTWAGWLYLATVIDCFNREVIGYPMVDHMRTSLVADALGVAARNHSLAAGCIFHSDGGT
jgi:putative transposase